ncbi:MAG: phenylacetate--CoA ligase family protein [Coriobacteriia bacterium]|jgi:phenylacetate-CoA ligase|nr:phenylacetate--CoA ligase family protein [Coriobacteriia bacterium]
MLSKIKQDPRVRLAALEAMNHLPARLAYSRPYFEVQEMLKRAESGEDISLALGSRLASVLRVALTQVPYYRELDLDVAPGEIDAQNAHEVLTRFPYLSKNDIMRDPEAFVAKTHNPRRLYQVRTGGSTGRPIRLYRSRFDQSAEAAFIHYGWGKAGYSRNARIARIGFEGAKPLDREPSSRWGNRLLVSPSHLNERWVVHICDEFQKFAPEFIHSYPSGFEYLADYMRRSGFALPSVKAILLASEEVTERQLRLAEEAFAGVPVIFHYGLSERSSLAWGRWSGEGISYVLEPVYGHSENRAHAWGGQEIVGTSYWNEVMPLIRYRTQDFGEITDGVLQSIEGREQEYLTTHMGTKVPGICIDLELLLDYVHGVQIVQDKAGSLEFRVVPRAEYDDTLGARFLKSQHDKWQNAFDFTLSITDQVERSSSGKALRYVINSDPPESSD